MDTKRLERQNVDYEEKLKKEDGKLFFAYVSGRTWCNKFLEWNFPVVFP